MIPRQDTVWPGFMGESGKIRFDAIEYCVGERGLDLGCGPFKITQSALGVDSGEDQSLVQHFGQMQAQICCNVEKLPMFASNHFDYVFSSHTLEHIEKWEAALKEWWRLVRPGGHLILYLPDPVAYEMAQPGMGEKSGHKADIYVKELVEVMRGLGGWDLLRAELRERTAEQWYLSEYSNFIVFKKRKDRRQIMSYQQRPDPKNVAAFVRSGGIGDILVASSILPHLKEAGWHVRVFGNKATYEALRENPYVDSFCIDTDEHIKGDTGELGAYWGHIQDTYGVTVNLWQTFETLGIAKHPDAGHLFWPTAARRNIYGHLNYLELAHITMDIPFPAAVKFYPDKEAKDIARRFLRSIDAKDSVVLYVALMGTGVHKVVPRVPEALMKLMARYPFLKLVLSSVKEGAGLQSFYPDDDRIYKKAGKWGLHTSMAVAQKADIVLGPETGLLNAVGMDSGVAKVVFLSHSNERNLTEYWENSTAVIPDCECHPCHMLHHKWDEVCQPFSVEGYPDKYAKCAAEIHPQQIVDALEPYILEVAASKGIEIEEVKETA